MARCGASQYLAGKLSALYVVGSNPVVDYNFDPAALQNTFTRVCDARGALLHAFRDWHAEA